MREKFGYVVVEGPHDVEFVYRLLRPFGLERVRFEANLDPYFHPLIPRSYPPGGDLQKRMPTPLFLQGPSHAVAIHSARGASRLVETIEENQSLIDPARLTGVGILLDADTDASPGVRYGAIRDALRGKGFPFPEEAGSVDHGACRYGGFVLPDNASPGTLEDLLLECACEMYPSLLATASVHVDAAISDAGLLSEDRAELVKPAGRSKAIVGAIASVLRPGRAIQVSIQDNRWVRDAALALPRVQAVQRFLASLLDLPPSVAAARAPFGA